MTLGTQAMPKRSEEIASETGWLGLWYGRLHISLLCCELQFNFSVFFLQGRFKGNRKMSGCHFRSCFDS